MTSLVPAPARGRVFRARRRVRLADADASGRLRLDAIARYLQDVAADDVADAGWAADEHVWVVRRTVVEVAAPPAVDEEVELATWCGGVAGSAAARRTSLRGDAGGLVETETIWIHLDRSMRPARLGERFLSVYGEACGGRRASTRLELPGPPPGAESTPWPLRATDVDRLGHVNNAAFWAPVEEHLSPLLRGPVRATLEYRQPIDLGEAVEVAHDGTMLWLVAGGEVRASARLERE